MIKGTSKRKLKIATMVTGHFVIPQPKGVVYAPLDLAVDITKGLTARGHEISFYAVQGSNIPGLNFKTLSLEPLKQKWAQLMKENNGDINENSKGRIEIVWEQYIIAEMFRAQAKERYDLLHIHPVDAALSLARCHEKIPVVYTLHDPIYSWRKTLYETFVTNNQWYVAISEAQRRPAPDLPYLATIQHGVNTSTIPFSPEPGSYLLFVGRIIPRKGVAEAVAVARQLDEKLLIVGPIDDQQYWETSIKPFLNDKIVHVGYVDHADTYKYFKEAKALLFPIKWEEPFGLVMIEAMACGTPVIAFRRGSVPEVVVDGKTGFIIETAEQMVEAVKKIPHIDRAQCRKHVETNFSQDKMIDRYEKAYYELLEKIS